MSSPFYSQRLGALTAEQFQAALTRFGLGTFVEATPISQGLFGQNVFVRSSQGDYVLRGVPHYPWQFPKERLGAALLHKHTPVPVAYPYLLDASTDIFGWPYLLMPRLDGRSPSHPDLTEEDQLDIAQALGRNLVHMHELTWPAAGTYHLASDTIQPFEESFAQWMIADTRRWLAAAQTNGGRTTAGDAAWIEEVINHAQAALAHTFEPCFVMNDYNPGNILVGRIEGKWQVTGLFDLMEYYFGNGEADLMRMVALYLEQDRQRGTQLVRAFVTTYLAQRPAQEGFAERYALFMLRDRLIVWDYGTRPGNNWFPPGQSFRDYAEPFTQSWRLIRSDSLHNFFQELYKNFNDRNIELVISHLTDNVKWANGMEGGYVYGRDGVKEYWTRQFTMVNSRVTPLEIHAKNEVVEIKVHQVVHDLGGKLLADETVYHFFQLTDNKVAVFDIGEKTENEYP